MELNIDLFLNRNRVSGTNYKRPKVQRKRENKHKQQFFFKK